MPYGTITSTTNTFGTVDGSVSGAIPGTLTGSVGVPGPQGPAGSQGPQGEPGEGVPVGGTAGQVLAKVDGVDYNTEWIDVATDARSLTDYDFTNVADTKLETFGLTIYPSSTTSVPYNSFLNSDELQFYRDGTSGGTAAGFEYDALLEKSALTIRNREWADVDGAIEVVGSLGINLSAEQGLKFINWDGTLKSSYVTYGPGFITFGDSTTQTTAFPGFNNAALTGNPTAPTATFGDNDTSIATTAFVQAGLLGGTANARNLEVEVRNQSGSTIPAGSIVYISGATGNKPLITLAQANNDTNSAQTIGFVKTSIANNGTGYVIVRGILENIDTSALTEGVQLYLSPTTAGGWTTSKPSAPLHLVYVGIVIRSHPTLGTVLVAVQNGYELDEIHDVAIASKANNDLLAYETSTDLWKNKSFSALGLATESFVTGQGYITAAAVPAFATNAQAVAGTSTTTVMSPASAYWADKRSGHSFLQFASFTATTSGTGSSASIIASGYIVAAPTSAAGHGVGAFSFSPAQRGVNRGNGSWNWSKRFTATFRYARLSSASDANSISRVTFGKTIIAGDPVTHCVGIRMSGSTALQLIVHNGTTLTAVTTTSNIVPTVPITTDMRIVSDGAGNVSLYVNDVLEATTSAGPTGTSGTASANLVDTEAQNAAIITGTAASHAIYNLHFEFAD